MTAAHCVYELKFFSFIFSFENIFLKSIYLLKYYSYTHPRYYDIDIGVHDKQQLDSWSLKKKKISKIIIHKDYDEKTLMNDIALLRLNVLIFFFNLDLCRFKF